jgi:signal transduction histidine kinase
MMLIDLKLALFVALLLLAGCAATVWAGARRVLQRPASVNTALADIHEELPLGLALLYPDGAVLHANAEAQRMLPGLDVTSLLGGTSLRRDGEPPRRDTPSSGLITHPVALRWWCYPLDDQGTLLLLVDNGEYQRLVGRQHAFIGQLAHELRNPLTALIAHLDVVRNPATGEALRDRSLDTIQHEIHRLARLVRDLLELHRLEAGGDLALRPTNLLLVVEDALAQVYPRAEQRGAHMTLDAARPLPLVRAHADRLTQVFLNLLDNAVKFCRPGDSITVRLSVLPEGVRCAVADSGPGIADADLPHVRAALYRGRADVEGSGIGLALVDEIVRRHHAALEIESATDPARSGTVCSWTLPIAEEQP